MSIRAEDLDNLQQLVTLLNDWRDAAGDIGLALKEVSVLPSGAYYPVRVTFDENAPEPTWAIDG
jgi:hypothetical protein